MLLEGVIDCFTRDIQRCRGNVYQLFSKNIGKELACHIKHFAFMTSDSGQDYPLGQGLVGLHTVIGNVKENIIVP